MSPDFQAGLRMGIELENARCRKIVEDIQQSSLQWDVLDQHERVCATTDAILLKLKGPK